MPKFTAEELTVICRNVFQKLSIPASEAEIVTRSMVDANRVGHDSHGVIHLPKYVRELEAGLIQPGASTETRHESASIAVLDGNWGSVRSLRRAPLNWRFRRHNRQTSVLLLCHGAMKWVG